MHRRSLELALAGALGAALAWLAPDAPAARGQGETPALVRGGGSAGVEKEPSYRFTTLSGNTAGAQFDRNVIKVPAYYGELVTIVNGGRQPVLWFRAADGSLRNVILSDAQSLVRLVREASRER